MPRSPYYDEIRETLARQGFIGTDPRHVEAFMRTEHSTLDHLTRSTFDSEVEIGALCTRQDPEGAEDLALSFGL